jgi:hypothetical protein
MKKMVTSCLALNVPGECDLSKTFSKLQPYGHASYRAIYTPSMEKLSHVNTFGIRSLHFRSFHFDNVQVVYDSTLTRFCAAYEKVAHRALPGSGIRRDIFPQAHAT